MNHARKRLFTIGLSSAELIFAAALWGFGFVSAVWALKIWTPAQLLFLRFTIGVLVGGLVQIFIGLPERKEALALLRLSLWPSICLMAMLSFQTFGLVHTTATKSGFITVLYVVLVPLLQIFFGRKRLPSVYWALVALSLTGVVLIVDFRLSGDWNRGDALTLVCALAASFQILALDRAGPRIRSPFLFNTFQSFWCWLVAGGLLLFDKPLVWTLEVQPWIGILQMSIGGTLIAFFLQVKAQKVLSPTASSLFFLLESPFTLLFAYFLLGENLREREAWGAGLILISAALAVLVEAHRKKASGSIGRGASIDPT